jgi:SAM-dependent methyltransferase
VALMPAALGVLGWPSEGPNRVTLADEGELPFADYSIDRVLIVHAVETSEQIRPMLKEIWRVLAGGGRLLIVVPNRRGIWARLDRTPFGSGRPYTMSQLSQLLRDELFTPIGSDTALFIPPLRKRMILRSAPAWERIGKRWFPTFAGVVLIEATKQIYAKPAVARMPRRRLIYTPAPHGLSRSGAGSPTCGPGTWATAFVSRRLSDSTNTLCSASKFARLPWGSRE